MQYINWTTADKVSIVTNGNDTMAARANQVTSSSLSQMKRELRSQTVKTPESSRETLRIPSSVFEGIITIVIDA